LSETWIVARREFAAFVRTRVFVLTTLFGPLVMLGFLLLPRVFASPHGSGVIAVIDRSGRGLGESVARSIEDAAQGGDRGLRVRLVKGRPVATPDLVPDSADAVVTLPADVGGGAAVRYEARGAAGLDAVSAVRYGVDHALRDERLRAQGIDPAAVDRALAGTSLEIVRTGQRAEASEASLEPVLYFATFLLYLAVLLYGNAVLRGVREEKENRVVELVLSSVRAESLMAGKVFGIGAAGLLQMAIWVAVGLFVSQYGGGLLEALGGVAPKVPHVPVGSALVVLLFFGGGYFLYAALYAGLGAMATSGQEAQQLQFPAMVPLIVAYFMVFGVMSDPDRPLAVVGSLIPFTSLLVVPARAILGAIGLGELALSAAILAVSCWGALWVGGKVYRVAILATGQRPSFRQVWRWMLES